MGKVLRLAPLLMLAAVAASTSRAGDIGFSEEFALAPDRTEALKQLIPGTEDYYFYHCLHFQHKGESGKVADLMKLWAQRYGATTRYQEIENRQALLSYEKDPKKALEFVRNRIGVQYNHYKEELEKKPNLPLKLDLKTIARETLKQRAFSHHGDLSGFSDSALDWLVAENLNADRRRMLLQRLRRPDYPKLPELVVDDLKHQHSGGFGSLEIHKLLLLDQMDECLKRHADLLSNTNFINHYIKKLQPNPDVDWQHDAKEKEAYLARLLAFTRKLAPAHNSLKAHVLYHALATNRAAGKYDKDLFMEYLKLPRQVHYMRPEYLQRDEFRGKIAVLQGNYQSFTLFPPIYNDEPLVRDYLMQYFTAEDDLKPYELYIHDNYLKDLFAEAKILAGVGDQEKWYSLLNNPARYQELKSRVDLEFSPQSKNHFKADEPVAIALDVKNVQTLLVKVFEINTHNFYRENLREVDTTINLDGLVASEEKTYNYGEPALRRMRRVFEFPTLKSTGVYVVDFIGNGKSSRAVIRKGQLRFVERTGAAGHAFTVLDENNVKQPNATIWMGGRDYKADKNGEVHVPYSTNPARTPLILSSGGFHDLEFFQHQGENYTLRAGFYVDREALIKRRKAELIVRPSLSINGVPVALKLLENPAITLATLDRDGVRTTKVISNVKLDENAETIVDIQVPENLLELSVQLTAKVQNVSQGKKVDLAVADQFALNRVDQTTHVDAPYLSRTANGYVLLLLGKTGEPRVEKAVNVELKHRDFTETVHASLATDASGRVELGALPDIEWVRAVGGSGVDLTWNLARDAHNLPGSVNGKTGSTLFVPYLGSALKPDRTELSLLERRGETFVKDWFEKLSIANGFIEIKDLPPGDYDLLLKDQRASIAVQITGGEQRDGFVLSESRVLQLRNAAPLNIVSTEAGNDAVKITLANSTEATRVHVFASRFEASYPAFTKLNNVAFDEATAISLVKDDSVYISGRNIGDEFQYILERKFATKFPGNMLKRPALLLNPWAIRTTDTGTNEAQQGGEFGQRDGGGRRIMAKRQGGGIAVEGGTANSVNVDFLPQSALVLTNLKPDKDGVVTVARKDLGDLQYIRVVAVDPQNTAFRSVALPETKLTPLDLRLTNGLDPKKHFTEQKQVAILAKDGVFTLTNISTSGLEVYDSLEKVFRLYKTLSGDARLDEFSFLTTWPKLKPEEKREKYSKFASHELNFFLSQKDPAFFKENVAPYLRNKKDKTFMDHWLLGENLASYLQPWKYQRLNTVERVLLARSLDGERDAAARHVREIFELKPIDMERLNHLFKTALKGSAMDSDNELGLQLAQEQESLKRADGRQLDNLAAEAKQNENFFGANVNGLANKDAVKKFKEVPGMPAEKAAAEAPAPALSAAAPAAPAAKPRAARRGAAAADELEVVADRKQDAQQEVRKRLAELDDDIVARNAVQVLYRKLDKTEEFAENNYFKLPIEQQLAQLVPVNGFWKDYAESKAGVAFLSTNVAEPALNLTEMICALAVLDLPFESPKHQTEFKDARMTLTAGGAAIVFHKQILESAPGEKTPVLVSQNFFRLDDRYRHDGNERYDKYVGDEFLTHVVYGCQVVLTNPTSSPQKLELLTQVPAGAVPVNNGFYTRGQYVQVGPYSTVNYEFHFYFPLSGDMAHYPVHVSKNEKLVASAEPVVLKVVNRLSKLDTASWQYISQHGTPDDVLKYLRENNVHRLDLTKIAWRMRDPAFFETVTSLLSARHAYDQTLWSYALLVDNAAAAREYLQFSDGFVNQCGAYIDTKLVTIDPTVRYAYQHLEYSPLLNARAHKLGKDRKILNTRFHEQYMREMNVLCYRPALNDEDYLAVTYYLLLQDRIEDAQVAFQKIQPTRVAERMQYDYLRAYLDFYSPERKEARAIAMQYKDHPVDRWANVFREVLNQLDEIDGKSTNIVDKEDRDQKQTKLAATDPSFEFKVESRKVLVNFQNLGELQVKYYLMDVELLFSGSPFVQQHGGQFAYIRPNKLETVKLPEKQSEFTFALPDEFHSSNVMVEITAGGVRKTQAYYANSLAVQVTENFGQLRVAHEKSNAPLPKTYVKVYARMKDGRIQFYKDGYTDLRGRFDYTSLSTNELDNVDRFALLVMSEGNGAVVREASAPKQ